MKIRSCRQGSDGLIEARLDLASRARLTAPPAAETRWAAIEQLRCAARLCSPKMASGAPPAQHSAAASAGPRARRVAARAAAARERQRFEPVALASEPGGGKVADLGLTTTATRLRARRQPLQSAVLDHHDQRGRPASQATGAQGRSRPRPGPGRLGPTVARFNPTCRGYGQELFSSPSFGRPQGALQAQSPQEGIARRYV